MPGTQWGLGESGSTSHPLPSPSPLRGPAGPAAQPAPSPGRLGLGWAGDSKPLSELLPSGRKKLCLASGVFTLFLFLKGNTQNWTEGSLLGAGMGLGNPVLPTGRASLRLQGSQQGAPSQGAGWVGVLAPQAGAEGGNGTLPRHVQVPLGPTSPSCVPGLPPQTPLPASLGLQAALAKWVPCSAVQTRRPRPREGRETGAMSRGFQSSFSLIPRRVSSAQGLKRKKKKASQPPSLPPVEAGGGFPGQGGGSGRGGGWAPAKSQLLGGAFLLGVHCCVPR